MLLVSALKQKIIIFEVLFLVFFVLFASFSFVRAQGIDNAINGLNQSARSGYLGETKVNIGNIGPNEGIITNIPTAIGKVIGAGLAFIGIAFMLLMIYGGFIWMTARGNEQQVEKAKDLIVSAIIGLIIVLAAYVIVKYIGNVLFTSTPTTPTPS